VLEGLERNDSKAGLGKMKTKNIIKDQNGVTAVEFAIILPLLLVFMFGIIEFSLLLYNKAMITNASREAARNAVVFRNPSLTQLQLDAQVLNVADAYCLTSLISFDGNKSPDVLSVVLGDENGNGTSGQSGETITVTVNYNYQFLIFPNMMELIKGSFTNSIPLQAITIMKFE